VRYTNTGGTLKERYIQIITGIHKYEQMLIFVNTGITLYVDYTNAMNVKEELLLLCNA